MCLNQLADWQTVYILIRHSDLGVPCLLRSVCLNSRGKNGKYDVKEVKDPRNQFRTCVTRYIVSYTMDIDKKQNMIRLCKLIGCSAYF